MDMGLRKLTIFNESLRYSPLPKFTEIITSVSVYKYIERWGITGAIPRGKDHSRVPPEERVLRNC
jgi:hypothetical protein